MTTTIISYNEETPSGDLSMPFGNKEERNVVQYRTAFDTAAGNISFENEAFFRKREDGYKLVWTDSLIYPGLSSKDRVRVSTTQAKRGEILDRNGNVLAGPGVASSVGIVPGKLENRDNAIEHMAELLEIPGVMISDTEVRAYPLGDAAAHLVGYVQSVTAEDLKEHAGEGYTASSVIGRSGAEGLFESELKGQNGCRIYIEDDEGNTKEELADRLVEHGKTMQPKQQKPQIELHPAG